MLTYADVCCMLTHADYCGQTGNFGAVVIFHCDMSYTIEEHVAPPLESLVRCLLALLVQKYVLLYQ
jgi:hypothetical protein